MNSYSIKDVSNLSGLSAHCIRAWEKRYGAIKPQRLDNGRRMYSDQEVERLVLLQKISSMGHSIGLIAQHSNEELESMLTMMGGGASPQEPRDFMDPEDSIQRILGSLKTYDLNRLTQELTLASQQLSYRDYALKVLAVLFRTVGRLVIEGELTISQEHTLSALAKFFIGNTLSNHYQDSSRKKTKILLAAPRGEHHSLGLLLSALLIAEYKYDLVYLGENLPIPTIADAVLATDSDIVLTTFVVTDGDAPLKKLRELLGPRKEIWVGGNLTRLSSQVAKDIPSKLFSSLEQLDLWLQEATNLVTIK
jgi:MerR family transcriptional regulator, light-induced transcriptional regulator